MKPAIKYYHFLAVLIVAIFFTKCVENHVLPNFGKIYLNTNPPGAVIYLNDENTGKVTPDSLTELVSGEYNISLRLPAYNDSSFTVQLDEDQVLNLNVNLDETNPQGLIVLNSDPIGAEIWLNGSQTGNVTPDSVFALLREDHTITLKLAEFIDTTFQVEFDGNSRLEYDIYLIESDPQGEITLTSEPVGANITFNGQSTGRTTPATFSNLERGTYQIQLSLNLYEMAEFEIELLKDQKISRNTDLVIAGSSGSLFINSEPQGAQIYLNNTNTDKTTPNTIEPLSPGNYDVRLSLADYRDTTISTVVNAGTVTNENVILTFYEPRGSISLDSQPQGAEIFIGDSSTGTFTPGRIGKLEAGDYDITLKLDAYFDTTFTVQVLEDQNTNVPLVQLSIIPYEINVTVSPDNSGTVSGSGNYAPGSEVTLIATPNTGYEFVNWTEGGLEVGASPTLNFTAESDRNLIANFNLKSYQITAMPNPVEGGSVEGAGIYRHGEFVQLTATANDNYEFVNWTEDGNPLSTQNIFGFTAVSDRNLEANFVGIGNLIVSSDPIGASISLNNEFTGQTTPHEFENLNSGTYSVKLTLEDFADTTIITDVFPGQTTDLGVVFLRDTTSDVEVTITYQVNEITQRITFFFVFNQDIRFNRVDVTDPNGTFFQFPFNNQPFPQGFPADLSFPEKIDGEWTFTCLGNKSGGRQTSFNITESVTVE